jgi:hypothetical protein
MRISNIVSQTVRDDEEKAKQSGRELQAGTEDGESPNSDE